MRTILRFRIWMLGAWILLSANACDDFLDINKNPNFLPDALIQNVLPSAQIGIGFNLGNTTQILSSLWIQHMAGTGTQTQPYDVYNVTPNDFNNDWNSYYATILDDLAYVISKGTAEGNNVHVGMAKILFAYTTLVITDMWGDVPFADALKIEEVLKPKYQTQESIYTALLTLLDEAKLNIKSTNVLATSTGDLIYGGVITNWERLANSIKLKLLLQLRIRNAAKAKADIDALITENLLINSNAGNFQVNFLTTTGAQNPIYQYQHLTRQNDMITSRRFYDSLVQYNDPRIPYYFTNITGGTYPVYDNGLNVSTAFPGAGSPANLINRSRWGRYVVGNGSQIGNGSITAGGAAPIRLVTKSMVNFWLAEAALTLGTAGNASTLFEQAMRDQFADISTFTGAPASFISVDAEAYILARKAAFDAAVATTGPGGKLNILIREKWSSSVGIAYESYNDYRRTGFPNLIKAVNNQAGVPIIPYRMPYVNSELQANADNVPLKTYPEGILVKVWWMGN